MGHHSEKISLTSVHSTLNRYFDALFDGELDGYKAEEELACYKALHESDYAAQYILSAYRMQMLSQAVWNDAQHVSCSAAQTYHEDAAAAIIAGLSASNQLERDEHLAAAHELRSKSELFDEGRRRYQNRADHAEQFMKKV